MIKLFHPGEVLDFIVGNFNPEVGDPFCTTGDRTSAVKRELVHFPEPPVLIIYKVVIPQYGFTCQL